MKSQYQVVVIGGGIVGCSVAYHLTLRGLTDVAVIERSELTAGSTWHAAGGFHAINSDFDVAALQKYTISLYPQVEEESGQSIGLKLSGGLELAGTPERAQWLKSELAWLRAMGTDAQLLSPREAVEMVPIIDPTGLTGALFDPHEGNLDPNGATHAYAGAAKQRGAEVILRNRVTSLSRLPSGEWKVETEKGAITAEHIVNAAGLWARRVGNMVGVDHPLVPMPHHYLITEAIPEVAAIDGLMAAVTDLEGFTYLQREGDGVLLGLYEQNPRHWAVEGAPWDFGMTLFPEEIDRIMPELSIGFERFPVLQDVGIKRWVNGAFTFTPDGNPLVGPVEGIPNYWAACGCMSGFSQCAGIGLVLANWIVDGDPGLNAFGMDVARFGPYASEDRYLRDTTAQFYARRFVMAYPNEELPAGRPLKTTPCYDDLAAAGARFSVNWGLEVPLYFAPSPEFEEDETLGRSNAESLVAEEAAAVRSAAGAYEIAQYARYEVSGPGAEAWLDRLVASHIPATGWIRLAPMLGEAGRLMGDLSVSRLEDQRFWLTGSYYLQAWHQRWFRQHLPESGVTLRNITDDWMGFSLSGPASRAILEQLASEDVSDAAFPFLAIRTLDVGGASAVVGRISLTGELGYEVVVPAERHRALLQQLREAGRASGLRLIGDRAIDSLRLEKAYGIWNAEFTQAYTPGMSGLDRFVAFDKGDFIGREAALREREAGVSQRLVLLEVDAGDADASADDGIWIGERRVGFVTSGAYGHHVKKSLALAYLDREFSESADEFDIYIVGEARTARILSEVPYDPSGSKLRG
ncbi:MAG: FAD-dependent oxidoreductase [Deltaproteobacteria bacterium]|jgi:dimethylglycine dehydrogenase|nr:FAD-dependent oxidoreductase [Deltaproteobacteria bacterium]